MRKWSSLLMTLKVSSSAASHKSQLQNLGFREAFFVIPSEAEESSRSGARTRVRADAYLNRDTVGESLRVDPSTRPRLRAAGSG
jgi:hypothetical protein